MSEEGRIQELEWQVKDMQNDINALHARVHTLEKTINELREEQEERIQALEQTVRQLSEIHP